METQEFRQQLKEGLDQVFGLKFVAKERYTLGWSDPRKVQITEYDYKKMLEYGLDPESRADLLGYARAKTWRDTPPIVEEPKFEIRWWHRVIYFFYKLARRCL